jgi:tetratricopeptide (TPR) repeat protein
MGQSFRQLKLANQKERVYNLADLFGSPEETLEPEDYLILATFSQSHRLEPNSHFYSDLLGDTYWNAGLEDPALEFYREGVFLAPMTDLHLFLQEPNLGERRLAAALNGFGKALAEQGVVPQAEIHRQIAKLKETAGDRQGAIDSLDEALASPGNLSGGVEHYHIGRLWMELGEPELSNESLERYLELDPGRGNALLMMGINYGQLGDHARAVRFMKQAIFQEPNRVRFHLALAKEYKSFEEMEQAESSYRTALRLDPSAAGVYSSLVTLYVENNQFRKAIALLEEWGERDPENQIQRDWYERIQSHIRD